ncbi:sugar ABC transporter ATP-binding protein [Blastococcus sp. SYSU DS0617]
MTPVGGAGTEPAAPSVAVRGLTKDFGQNRVLDHVDISFHAGSIHALLGANGSGKSTLIKILAGYHEATAGKVLLHGEELHSPITPAAVHAAGVRFVHQDLGLVESMSVQDNLALALGFESGPAGTIRWRAQRAATRSDLEAVGLDIDPRTPVGELGPVQKTLVAMARALRGLEPGRGVLVLDEPTARLPHAQVDELLQRCRALRDADVALIYVSHRLDEVFAMADQVTVLRDGRVVFDDSVTATDEARLTATITGRSADRTPVVAGRSGRVSRPADDRGLVLRNVTGARVRDVSLEVRPGELVAVTGLIGSGRSELGRLVFGAQARRSGTIELDGEVIDRPTPRGSVDRGVGYVPQDRSQAAVRTFSVAENVSLTDLPRLLRRGVLSGARRRTVAWKAIQDLDVRPADPEKALGELSGGNQQKVILAKWLQLDLKLLLLDEPTYGVDVGAREAIMSTVVDRVRNDGLAVLLLDSDIELIAAYADRVLVMRRGSLVAELSGEEITHERISAAAYAVDTSVGPTPHSPSTIQEAS